MTTDKLDEAAELIAIAKKLYTRGRKDIAELTACDAMEKIEAWLEEVEVKS